MIHLKELYLQRNNISTFQNLSSIRNIQNIQILWLSQNKLTSLPIGFLNYFPQLKELWLQGNNLTSLDSLQINSNHCLERLGLAGNPINDLNQIYYLQSLIYLKDISFQDIHFGQCPIVSMDPFGYKQFILLNLKKLQILDGIVIQSNEVMNAYHYLEEEVSLLIYIRY